MNTQSLVELGYEIVSGKIVRVDGTGFAMQDAGYLLTHGIMPDNSIMPEEIEMGANWVAPVVVTNNNTEGDNEMNEVTTRTNGSVKMTEEEVKIVAEMAIATAISQGAEITEAQKLEVLNAIREENGYEPIVINKEEEVKVIDKMKLTTIVGTEYTPSIAPLEPEDKKIVFAIIGGKNPAIDNPSPRLKALIDRCLVVVETKSIDDLLQEKAAKILAKANRPKITTEEIVKNVTIGARAVAQVGTNVVYTTTKNVVKGIYTGLKEGIKGNTTSVQDILKYRVK